MTRTIKSTLIWVALSLPAFAGDFGVASFEFPTCTVTAPTGLNIRAQVVGLCFDGSGAHGFMLNLNPSARHSALRYINARGDITGIYTDSDAGPIHGFPLKNGIFRTVDFPGSTQTDVVIINNSGLIIGDYFDANGNEHGFMAIECPHSKCND